MTRQTRKPVVFGTGAAIFVVVLMIVGAPLVYMGLRQIRLENDIETWLPEQDAGARVLQWYLDHFEHEKTILVAWEGSTLNDPRVARFADQVAGPADAEGNRTGGLEGVTDVNTPRDVIARMLENGIPREQAIEQLNGVLIGTGMLKVRLSRVGRSERAEIERQIIRKSEEQLGLDVDVQPPLDDRFAELAERTSTEDTDDDAEDAEEFAVRDDEPYPAPPPHDFQLHWKDISPKSPHTNDVCQLVESLEVDGQPAVDDCFFWLGAPVGLSVKISAEGEERVLTLVDEMREVAVDVGVPAEAIRFGGQPVASAMLDLEASRALWNPNYPVWMFHKRSPVLLSALVGMLVSFVVLGSIRLSLLVTMVSMYTGLSVFALVPATGGNVNMVLVVMPNLLLVLTTSGAIHVANYWRHARHEGKKDPVSQAVRMAFQPCLLASTTTAIGLASLTTSILSPVRDFGIYSSAGCGLSLLMVLFGFPALLVIWPGGRKVDPEKDFRGWQQVGRWLAKHGTVISTITIIVFVASVAGLRYFYTETKVIRYFPEDSQIVENYEFLEENLAGILTVDTIVRFDAEAIEETSILERLEVVREVQNRIRTVEGISGTLSLADFRPTIEPPGDDASVLQKINYRRAIQRTERGIFEEQTESSGQFVTKVHEPLEFLRDGKPVQFSEGDEAWRIRVQGGVMSDLDFLGVVSNMGTVTQEVIGDRVGTSYVVTGMLPLFLRTQEAVLESLIESFALAFGLIAIVMMFVLRNVLAGLLTMLPNLMPVGLVFGLISWFGVSVDIGTMITASVALGIAVDGTLHLLTWFQDGIDKGMTRSEAIAQGLGHCGPAMWQTSASIALAMLMLGGAELLLISRFGWLMASLIGAALIGDVIFLPALLGGPLGTVIERQVLKRRAAEEAETSESPAHETSEVGQPGV
ncbi:MMPL family protein [Maioricimonas rarisocia]|uniref:MMPL family protein n=1 Tax=Maioricimonas rarisocia TaxID=2528026 RepID=A0A517Z798_9PLAN|nr:MMPL family transporter [Maioricimonas rarisocia]QDU38362.1 MMPL family protein [Maioricimonas rarisocia]